jgi:putative oxidoreductase
LIVGDTFDTVFRLGQLWDGSVGRNKYMRGEKSREKRVRIETMSNLVARVKQWHDQFFALVSYLQSPFLLFVRLYWGWQLAQSGWGKLHHLPNVTEFFGSLGLPMPAQMAVFIACVEFFGGIFLALGLCSRITSLVLSVNLTMAYVLGDREALLSFFSDPDKFIAAAPFAFLIVSLIVLVFGAGRISVDTVLAYFYGSTRVKQANSVTA